MNLLTVTNLSAGYAGKQVINCLLYTSDAADD